MAELASRQLKWGTTGAAAQYEVVVAEEEFAAADWTTYASRLEDFAVPQAAKGIEVWVELQTGAQEVDVLAVSAACEQRQLK